MIKATDTHLEYVILIAFPLQQWLRESDSILPNNFAAFVVDTFILFCLEHTQSTTDTTRTILYNVTEVDKPSRGPGSPVQISVYRTLHRNYLYWSDSYQQQNTRDKFNICGSEHHAL
jgi:hypothetical protein